MKTMKWTVTLLSAMFLLISCSRTAYVQKDSDVDFSKIKTYSWVRSQAEKEKANGSMKNDDLTNRKIRQSIDRNLAEKGWKEVKSNPDVYLVYDVMIEQEDKIDRNAVYTQPFTRWFFNPVSRRWVPVLYPSRFLGFDENTRTVKEGTLTLTMMDADTDKTIWQGWTSSEINGRKLSDKQIDSKVKAIVKKLEE